MENKKEKKERTVKIRLSETDYQKLKSFSRISNLTMSEILRKLMNDRPPKIIENFPTDKFKMTVNRITRIGNFQKHLDNNIVRLIQSKTDLTIDELIQIKDEQDKYRQELLLDVSELRKILLEYLKEMR